MAGKAKTEYSVVIEDDDWKLVRCVTCDKTLGFVAETAQVRPLINHHDDKVHAGEREQG